MDISHATRGYGSNTESCTQPRDTTDDYSLNIIMSSQQKRLLEQAIDSLYVPIRTPQPRVLPATIYNEPASLRNKIDAILQKLNISTVDTYIFRCKSDSCLPWTGYKSLGYPQIKIRGERCTVTQILALLFLDHSSPSEKLQRSCPDKTCVNILHYYYATNKDAKASKEKRSR